MSVRSFVAGFCLLAAIAVPALANDGKPAKEKKICRSEDVTGSIMPKRTCHTAREWRELDEQRGRSAEQALDRARAGGLGKVD